MRHGQAHDLIDRLLDGGRSGEWVGARSVEVRWDGGDLFGVREPGGPARTVRGVTSLAACLTQGSVVPETARYSRVELRGLAMSSALRRRDHSG